MDLSTTYLGLELAHPLMPGASPLADSLDRVKRLEDSGAAAIVLRSLFEEQLEIEHRDSSTEATGLLPDPDEFRLGPDGYLEHLRKASEAVAVPVIASLNGFSGGDWVSAAELMADAGADAIELNLYRLVCDPTRDSASVEAEMVDLVADVVDSVDIPVAIKLSAFATALPNLAQRFERAGAAGLILFNRFHQPEIDIEELAVVRSLRLSDPSELLMRLRWLAILRGNLSGSLACSGGVHSVSDILKATMCGADAIQLVSVLLRNGPEHLTLLRRQLAEWLESHDYESLSQARSSMSLERCPDPAAFERANYMRILQGWRG